MRNKLLITLLGFAVMTLGFIATAIAVVPDHINYQGILRDSAGDLQSGTFEMTFKIYDHATSGSNLLLTDGPRNIEVSNGLYNAEVGTITGAIFDGGDRWIEVTVGSDVLAPRLKINSVAYAVQTENADYATTAGSANSATNADYATFSGTATNAGDADTVDSISANATPTSGQLYPLQTLGSDVGFSGIAVSAESSSGIALFVGGKLGAKTCVGTGEVPSTAAKSGWIIAPATTSSLILLSVGYGAAISNQNSNDTALCVTDIEAGQFKVGPVDGNTLHDGIPFCYLIIN